MDHTGVCLHKPEQSGSAVNHHDVKLHMLGRYVYTGYYVYGKKKSCSLSKKTAFHITGRVIRLKIGHLLPAWTD